MRKPQSIYVLASSHPIDFDIPDKLFIGKLQGTLIGKIVDTMEQANALAEKYRKEYPDYFIYIKY